MTIIFIKVILGNTNHYSVEIRPLSPRVYARYLRINPQYWKDWPCLRTEFLGCSTDEGNFNVISLPHCGERSFPLGMLSTMMSHPLL